MRGIRLVTSGLIAIALSVGPNPLPAGTLPAPVGDQDQKAEPNKADRLEAIAAELLADGDMDTWEQAAELLEKSARLRPEASSKRIENLRMAASLFVWTGATLHARDLFEEAAQGASEMGNLALAAHTYLDAAVLSAQLKMGRHTIQAARMADQLAASPDMPAEARQAVVYRLTQLGLPLHLGEIL
ncbi:MAG: hypothetical protein ACWGSQ_13700 [Longimicrobiales bacterium]